MPMKLDIEKLRSQTPGCRHVLHFNNAGASLLAEPVLHAVKKYLDEEAMYGGYEIAHRRKKEIREVYRSIATLINANEEEIAILENATAAWNMAFYAIQFSEGDRILTSVSEYASNFINYLNLKKNRNIKIEIIPNDAYGQTSPAALSGMMDDKVKLISITHIPTNNGLVNPAREIGKIAKNHQCLYLLDACQSVGQYPVDVQDIGCDVMSATGRKYMRAPRGTGFLYVNKKRLKELHPPFLDLHSADWIEKDSFSIRSDARRFENWEANYAGIIGLNKAVNYILELGIDSIWERIQQLAKALRSGLSSISSVRLHDIGRVQCGIVTFTLKGYAAEQVKINLADQNINVSVSTKNSTLIDMERRNLEEIIRASVHYYNTEEEINRFIETVNRLR